jgi:hypothetical protein
LSIILSGRAKIRRKKVFLNSKNDPLVVFMNPYLHIFSSVKICFNERNESRHFLKNIEPFLFSILNGTVMTDLSVFKRNMQKVTYTIQKIEKVKTFYEKMIELTKDIF